MVEDCKALLGLSCNIHIVEWARPGTAAVFGVFRPHLLLPKSMLERLDVQELRLVILHELVHIRRRDVLLNWLLIALQSLHWFNPAIWLAFKRLKAARELVCDTVVMAKLAPAERQTYGNTLIKLLDDSATLAPSLIPIVNHKHEIQRRIIMIAQFKPNPRFVSSASAMLLLALGCFTFTAAEEKDPLSRPPEKATDEFDVNRQKELDARGIIALVEELAKIDRQVRTKQSELNEAKDQLQISDLEDTGYGRPVPETLRKVEGLRAEAYADYQRQITLHRHLTNLSRATLVQALPTVSPDHQLASLLEQKSRAELRVEELGERLSADHPDLRVERKLLKQMDQQLNDRIDGIMIGLRAKIEATKASLQSLQAEVDKAQKIDVENAIKRRPYFDAKRELETLRQVHERLVLRIIQEKVDAAIPKTAPAFQTLTKRTFTVLGQVPAPGIYEISGEDKWNLPQALARAGGITVKGNPRKVTLSRLVNEKKHVFNLDAEEMIRTGDNQGFEILAGDIITVPQKVF